MSIEMKSVFASSMDFKMSEIAPFYFEMALA